MALASPCCYKLVARVGHYEYTDMALTAPYFMRASGLLALHPSELRVRRGVFVPRIPPKCAHV